MRSGSFGCFLGCSFCSSFFCRFGGRSGFGCFFSSGSFGSGFCSSLFCCLLCFIFCHLAIVFLHLAVVFLHLFFVFSLSGGLGSGLCGCSFCRGVYLRNLRCGSCSSRRRSRDRC